MNPIIVKVLLYGTRQAMWLGSRLIGLKATKKIQASEKIKVPMLVSVASAVGIASISFVCHDFIEFVIRKHNHEFIIEQLRKENEQLHERLMSYEK
jgi:hypothetical protein